MADELAQFSFLSAIRGHHVYMATWQHFSGEQLQAEREASNTIDIIASAIISMAILTIDMQSLLFECAPVARYLCHGSYYHARRQLVSRSHTLLLARRGSGLHRVVPFAAHNAIQSDCRPGQTSRNKMASF